GASGSLQSACFPGARRAESASCHGCRRRAPTARHVGVAPFIVNNNPETRERSRRSFPTATGWLFARPAVAHECWIAALSVSRAQRSTKWCAADTDLGFTRDRRLKCASRVNPTCVDRSSLWRSRISGAIARRRRASTRLWPHFVIRCTPSGTPDSVGRVRRLLPFLNSPSRSRGAFSAPGVCNFASLTPNRGVGGAPRNVRVRAKHPLGLHITRQVRRLARRLASHDAGRSPLGAPPWRFWASGPRFRLLRRPPSYNGGQLPCGPLQRAPPSQVLVPGGGPGGRLPGPPGANGYERPPQDATPYSAFRIVSRRRPSMSEPANI